MKPNNKQIQMTKTTAQNLISRSIGGLTSGILGISMLAGLLDTTYLRDFDNNHNIHLY